MSGPGLEFDLVVLAAGKNESQMVRTLIEKRPSSLGIRPITTAPPLIHEGRDPGCLRQASQVLRPFLSRASRALTIFDWEGSGREDQDSVELECQVTNRLEEQGWKDRCAVVVVAPELESWIWAASPHVSRALGWGDDYSAMVTTLESRGFVFHAGKPERPKEAVEYCLRQKRIPRSSALYAEIASTVSLKHCSDRSFQKLRTVLMNWFGRFSERETL